MSYTVLARKYRSQRFDDIIGQEPIAKTLKNAIRTGRVAHAYLFTGTRGIGKTTTARVLAKALNCLSVDEPTDTPCCKCESCIAVNLGDDIDVIEIDGASNNSVEEVRRLRENAIYRPARARFKIYIIDEIHMLSNSAFNALLKILEEPPEHVKFIFATTEPNKVIATIQSRCQRFDFKNINPRTIAEQLKSVLGQEKIEYEDDLIYPIAKMANGSMRDALSLLDRLISSSSDKLTVGLLEEFLGCSNNEKITNLISSIAASDAAKTLQAADDLITSGTSELQLVDALIEQMRDLMVIKSAGGDSELLILTAHQRKQAVELAEKFDVPALVYNITALEKMRWTIKTADNARALLEAMLLRFALSEHFLNVEQLLHGPAGKITSPVKKNAILNNKSTKNFSTPQIESIKEELPGAVQPKNLTNIKDSWQDILKVISAKLGNGTAGLLSTAEPVKFANDTLALCFAGESQMSMEMCKSNGRTDQIQSVLSEYFSSPVKLELVSNVESKETLMSSGQPKTPTELRKEILNDPAVKTVITGLGASIAKIEEANE